jgi:hypothetical protein
MANFPNSFYIGGSEIRPIMGGGDLPPPDRFQSNGRAIDDFPELKKLFSGRIPKKTAKQLAAIFEREKLKETVMNEFGKLSDEDQQAVLVFIKNLILKEIQTEKEKATNGR